MNSEFKRRRLLWMGAGFLAAAALLLGYWVKIKSPSYPPATIQFITVDKGVKLQVVDWGGSGRALVFIPGLGNTARQTFDEFAPKFTQDYHVYGITRRGFGNSSRPVSGYSADRLGDDVLAVLEALKLDRVVLVGHSMGGAELSSVATRHPERVAGLIYLEAAYAYAYHCPESPPPFPIDPKWSAPVKAILEGQQRFTDIRGPVLAIYAIPTDLSWRFKNDPAGLAKAEAEEIAKNLPQAKAFERGVPAARVVNIARANHWVFWSTEAEVLREMNAFLRKLPHNEERRQPEATTNALRRS
jgi:non-heme chloroperoxidase